MPRKGVRRCYWHHCRTPATDRVRFVVPHILAGQQRDYCTPHTDQVIQQPGARRFIKVGTRT
jgi:hypothetical protein